MSSTGALRRLSKLRAMSAREIATRIAYKVALASERRAHARGRLPVVDFPRSLAPSLRGDRWQERLLDARRTARARFFPSLAHPDEMRRLFAGPYRAELQDCLRHAAAARERRFEFFGQRFHYPAEIDWQRDPVSGRAWPARFHADVPVHGGDVGYGDVKHVWELNRQQHLIDLAKAHFLTGDAASLEAVRSHVRSWIKGNPYATGVNWSCALEPAFRAWSWLWAYHLTCSSLDDAFHIDWLNALCLHGRFLSRHLEHYSSPYNHLIGEASALYALGVCFPEFREAAAWKRYGRRVLTERLAEQFYADGGSREQSTFYHHATLGFYLLAALLARNNGDDLPPAVWQAIGRGLDFSLHLRWPDGRTPEIGGADDGKPIRLEHLPLWDFRPYLAVGAVTLDRGDLKRAAGRFHEDALWLLGTQGLHAFETLAEKDPRDTTVTLAASGYFVTRSDWSERADFLCFDIGEQAGGMRTDAVPNSMHGHADALSVIAALKGSRVLADSGLFAYNCGGEWEAHFRETAAHSTARVDGRDQALHLGKMAWSHSYRVHIEGTNTGEGGAWAVASHDGYARGPSGIRHRRAVWRRPGHYLVVWDEFTGAGDHELEVNFQFAPGTLQLEAPRTARLDDIAEVTWVGQVPWQATTCSGGPSPADGWICPSLGVPVAAPRLSLRARFEGPRTVLMAVIASAEPGRRRLAAFEPFQIRVEGGTGADWIVTDTESTAVPIAGFPAVCRIAGGEVVERVTMLQRPLEVDEMDLVARERMVGARAHP